MKIVINTCYGGFGLSDEVYDALDWPDPLDIKRNDPKLIGAIEKIGLENAGTEYSELKIVEIPEGVEWEIWDYDGCESIHEKHRVWR